MAEEETSTPTITIDDEVYNYEDLGDEGKYIFSLLSEVQPEMVGLTKRLSVLQAAQKTFVADLKNSLATTEE